MRWITLRQCIPRPEGSRGTTAHARWIGLLILLIVGFTCSYSRAESAPGAGAEKKTTPITLRFVSWKPDHQRVWDEAIAGFTKAHPHISVVRELAPHSSTAYHDLLTQKLKNRDATVDVFFIDVIWVPEFAAAGWARPLDSRFSPAMRDEFLPATVAVGRYGEHLYGVPSRIDAGLLYYRQDLLEKYGFTAPATWEELLQQAERIVAGEQQANPTLRGYSAQFKQTHFINLALEVAAPARRVRVLPAADVLLVHIEQGPAQGGGAEDIRQGQRLTIHPELGRAGHGVHGGRHMLPLRKGDHAVRGPEGRA